MAGHVGRRGLALRPEIQKIVDQLLEASEPTKELTLDAIGDAIGTKAISPPEIDQLMGALESAGRTVLGPTGGDGEQHLKKVVAAIRPLTSVLGRKPTPQEIAEQSGLSLLEVKHALALAKVMQR